MKKTSHSTSEPMAQTLLREHLRSKRRMEQLRTLRAKTEVPEAQAKFDEAIRLAETVEAERGRMREAWSRAE